MGITRTLAIKLAIALSLIIITATTAIIIAVTIHTNTISEQNFQQCITEAGGYQSNDADEMITIRDICDGYLR